MVVPSSFFRTVFSTHVEVIPKGLQKAFIDGSILHTCGGDPHVVLINKF